MYLKWSNNILRETLPLICRSAMVVSVNEEESDDDEDWDVTTETGTQLLENPSNFYRTAEEETVQTDIKQRRISRRLTRPDALFDFDDFVEPEFVKETYCFFIIIILNCNIISYLQNFGETIF